MAWDGCEEFDRASHRDVLEIFFSEEVNGSLSREFFFSHNRNLCRLEGNGTFYLTPRERF